MIQNRSYSTITQSKDQVLQLLRELKDENGKDLLELNLIHTLTVDKETNTVSIKLNLTKNYRKLKTLI